MGGWVRMERAHAGWLAAWHVPCGHSTCSGPLLFAMHTMPRKHCGVYARPAVMDDRQGGGGILQCGRHAGADGKLDKGQGADNSGLADKLCAAEPKERHKLGVMVSA